jgi:hypothetical protein
VFPVEHLFEPLFVVVCVEDLWDQDGTSVVRLWWVYGWFLSSSLYIFPVWQIDHTAVR